MTRNIRRKAAAPPAKTKRRRGSDNSSTPDLSSDGGYSALDEVSDSEDDDEDGVYAAEEKHIIKDVTKIRHGPSPRPVAQKEEEDADEEEGDGDGDGGSDDEDEDDLDDLDDADFADFIAQEDGNKDNDGGAEDSANAKFADDGASWNGISESDANHNGAVVGVQASPPKRQVRFAGVPDSDSDSTTSEVSVHDSQYFPDIFVEQNLLDPGFRREIEHESDSSVSSSFWDYSYGYGLEPDASAVQLSDADLFAAGLPDPVDVLLPPVVEKEEVVEDDELDGYETDGDTTEDDEPEPLPVRRKHARRIQLIDSDSDSSDSDSEIDMPINHRRGQPRARRYVLTPARRRRPVALIHPISGKMVILTPEKPPQLDIMSDPLFDPNTVLLPPLGGVMQSSPLMGNTASVMMGAMISSNTFGDYMHPQNIGPVEAFFPALSSDAFVGEDSDFSGEFVEDDGESNLRIEDFIQFDRNSADGTDPADGLFDMSVPAPLESDDIFFTLDSGIPDEDDAPTPLATPTAPPNTRRTSFAASSSIGADDEEDDDEGDDDNAMPPLLAHFGKNTGAVGAFRRNQIDQQLIYSHKATPDSLAFSAPFTMGTLRGIKNGSLEAVTTPITPPRRLKRQSISAFGADYVHSPLESTPQKRKASNAVTDDLMHHKRPRSISELGKIGL